MSNIKIIKRVWVYAGQTISSNLQSVLHDFCENLNNKVWQINILGESDCIKNFAVKAGLTVNIYNTKPPTTESTYGINIINCWQGIKQLDGRPEKQKSDTRITDEMARFGCLLQDSDVFIFFADSFVDSYGGLKSFLTIIALINIILGLRLIREDILEKKKIIVVDTKKLFKVKLGKNSSFFPMENLVNTASNSTEIIDLLTD